MKKHLLIWVLNCIVWSAPVWAGEGHMHGPNGEHITTESASEPAEENHMHGPNGEHLTTESESPAVQVTPGTAETAIELRLSDLAKGSAGVPMPLQGAKVTGFLKRGDSGEILSRVSAANETNGLYLLSFDGRNTHVFPGPGAYFLELNVAPAGDESFDTTVNFSLPEKKEPAKSIPLLWPILGSLIVLIVGAFFLKRRGRTKIAAVSLFALALHSSSYAGEGHMHGPNGEHITTESVPEPAEENHMHGPNGEHLTTESEPAQAAPAASTSNIALGEISSTTKAGSIQIVLTARTRLVSASTTSVGTVKLAPQTAKLLEIETAPAKVVPLAPGISFNGRIVPNPDGLARVASPVPGRITQLLVRQGQNVRRGQTLAIVESRAIGEAQSSFRQAQARLSNAQAQMNLVQRQAQAGVFLRGPVEVANRARAEALAELRQGEATLSKAQVEFESAIRLARAGAFGRPALETARKNAAVAEEERHETELETPILETRVRVAEAELRRRQGLMAAGSYNARPVEEARRILTTAQNSKNSAQSEVATARAAVERMQTLSREGLVARRDLETAQTTLQTATARFQTAEAEVETAQRELERQQKLAANSDVSQAEIVSAQNALNLAKSDLRNNQIRIGHKREFERAAIATERRERNVFNQNIANKREVAAARTDLLNARAMVVKARQTLKIAEASAARELRIARQNLNTLAQVQSARATLVSARAEADAARTALTLLQSAPNGGANVPIRAPMNGVVQERSALRGELVTADAPLFTLANLDVLAVEAQLFEADLSRIQNGAGLRFTVDAIPDRTYEGRVSFVGSDINATSRTVTARALVQNDGSLRLGLFARGQIQSGTPKLALTVPSSSVLDDGAAKIIFVAKADGYERREVKVGRAVDGKTEILSGLSQNEDIVTSGAAALRAQAVR